MGATKLISLIGAESTGKTTLAQALAKHFNSPWVPEYLRAFCESRGRTPRQDEQSLILETQFIDESVVKARAWEQHAPYVFCDTAPLLTAIYSDHIFNDQSLYARARTLHARYALTLLLAPDIAWVADGMQRDGAHVRAPITETILRELRGINAPFVRIEGEGEDRTLAAIGALQAVR